MSTRKEINCKDEVWPINYVDETREESIRVTLRSSIYFLTFVIIATIVITSKTSPFTYHYTKIIKEQFIDINFTPDKMYATTFDDIRTTDHFWRYLSDVAISNLYNTEWYILYYEKIFLKNLTEPKLLFENSLLGVPRLRMLQVTNNSCPIISFFRLHILQCFGYYSESTSNKFPVPWEPVAGDITNTTTEKPTTTTTTASPNATANSTTEEEEVPTNITGFNYTLPESKIRRFRFLSTNHSGGFIQKFARTKNESLLILQTLYTRRWVTRATRYVYFEFNLYNHNLKLFFVCKLNFEFLPCGGIIPTYHFQPINLSPYREPFDFVVLALELIFVFFIIYFIIQEFRTCGYYKKKYWTFFWTYINIFIIIASILLIGLNIYKIFFLPMVIKELGNNPKNYVNMDYVVFWQWFINNLEAILLFILWLKLIRFFNIHKVIKEMTTEYKNDIFLFIFMLCIILFAFALLGSILFGEQSEHFNHVGNALMTLLLIIPGYFKYDTIEENNKILAPIFFVSYILIVYGFLSFMLIGIIIDAYFKAKRKAKDKTSEIEVSEFLSRLSNKMMLFFPCLTSSKHLKMSSKEIIREMRSVLELCRFSDMEIKEYFLMHGIKENKTINEKDVINLLKLLKTYRETQISTDSVQIYPKESQTTIKYKTYLDQKRRLNSLGAQLFQISWNLGEITAIQQKTKE